MKPAVVFVLTFVLAGAASTGAKVVLTKPAAKPAATDSSKARSDSTKTDTAIVASGQPPAPPTDTAARPVAPDTSKGAKALGVVPQGAPATGTVAAGAAAAAAPGAKPAIDTVVQASERRLAKVFTSMDAKQAAKVLEHMADNDVQIILGYVGPRQAASILEALPPERVATLSKLAMGKK
jgi:hypothetical protein